MRTHTYILTYMYRTPASLSLPLSLSLYISCLVGIRKRLDPKPHTSHEARQSGERTNPPSLSFLTPLHAFTDQSSSRRQRGTGSESPKRGVCGVRLFDLLPSHSQNSNQWSIAATEHRRSLIDNAKYYRQNLNTSFSLPLLFPFPSHACLRPPPIIHLSLALPLLASDSNFTGPVSRGSRVVRSSTTRSQISFGGQISLRWAREREREREEGGGPICTSSRVPRFLSYQNIATPQRSITKRVPPSQNTTLPGGRSLFWDGQGHDETTAHIGVCFFWGHPLPVASSDGSRHASRSAVVASVRLGLGAVFFFLLLELQVLTDLNGLPGRLSAVFPACSWPMMGPLVLPVSCLVLVCTHPLLLNNTFGDEWPT
ncbi:hypothetical protein CDEST_13631 [Colletotrichum destructivum]|uniref:Uncharacterized protein n=1 Tax=Colletotrichum destructivum TaxID=34406 RepID=A0AAX4IZL6_9PEZI|nr:hypothetical protein CDEST_13631 [Colletotrichum destructivum]